MNILPGWQKYVATLPKTQLAALLKVTVLARESESADDPAFTVLNLVARFPLHAENLRKLGGDVEKVVREFTKSEEAVFVVADGGDGPYFAADRKREAEERAKREAVRGEAEAKLAVERRKAAIEERHDRHLDNSNIPGNVWESYKLDSFEVRRGAEAAVAAIKAVCADDADSHTLLTLHGNPGTGKTRLAIGACLEFIDNGRSAVYWQVERLLDALRWGYKDNRPPDVPGYDEIMTRIENCALLVLDDLGAESGTDWAQSKLDQIIDTRYISQAHTIITTNCLMRQLSPRIASRLMEGEVLTIKANDYRLIKGYRKAQAEGGQHE